MAIIDPGPNLEEHIYAIKEGLPGEVITHILVTHTHFDHWPGYQPLKKIYGAKTYGYHTAKDHLRNNSDDPSESKELSNQERFEISGFIPDVPVHHQDVIEGNGWSVECVFTPGHASNHMCYQLKEEKTLLSGDHIMAWSTSVISPPSGNMEQYMNSLELLLKRDDEYFWPAHGPGIKDTKNFVELFIAHRKEREQQILDQLEKGINTIPKMVTDIYRDVPDFLHPAARQSVLAAMIYMVKQGIVTCNGRTIRPF